ncbi:homeodomain-interacting protein kinase 4 isoform X1 [Pipra filicauda]|uniref:Homeodomain-interacting protein kinase 4 isoform X1 n=1 Tax=Pipra filicauda TaxID=649802 RepID=A0A6J2HW86_9PASS|nr:homeodomain-interacting protein kinase 4 isoform X1 [Pipra filicauda]
MVTLVVGAECYDLVATVGKGTFGQVTQGQRRSTGEMVAIKILRNHDYNGQTVRNELRLLQALREGDAEESHVVRFLESFSDTVWTYLVFELLQQNLFDFQKQNNFSPLPVRHIRTITAQVLAALVKLKELSIIHADLKPENIMLVDHLRYPFRVKLIDFGSAILLPEVYRVQKPYIQTRFYRAPEILLGLPFCEKVDVWSLGCVMAELHLGWPLYPGNNEYDQVRYICSTLGLPRAELLCAAQKTQSFFRQVPCSVGTWQLKPPGKVMAKPMERRVHVFSSLDQLAAVNLCLVSDPDQEELAKRCDLYAMVELVKRMLTWDSRERISPSAALHHPFISMQEVKSRFEATHYYQLSQEDLRASRKDSSRVEIFPGMEKGAFIPTGQGGFQKAIAQTGGLSLAELAGDTSSKNQHDICQAPIPTHWSSQCHQHHWCPKTEPTSGHLTVLGCPSSMERHGHCNGPVVGGIAEQNLRERRYSSSRAKRALVMRRDPWKPSGTWRAGSGMTAQCPARFSCHRAGDILSTTEPPRQPWHTPRQPRACRRSSSFSSPGNPATKTQHLAGGDHGQGCTRTHCAGCSRLCFSH